MLWANRALATYIKIDRIVKVVKVVNSEGSELVNSEGSELVNSECSELLNSEGGD